MNTLRLQRAPSRYYSSTLLPEVGTLCNSIFWYTWSHGNWSFRIVRARGMSLRGFGLRTIGFRSLGMGDDGMWVVVKIMVSFWVP